MWAVAFPHDVALVAQQPQSQPPHVVVLLVHYLPTVDDLQRVFEVCLDSSAQVDRTERALAQFVLQFVPGDGSTREIKH